MVSVTLTGTGPHALERLYPDLSSKMAMRETKAQAVMRSVCRICVERWPGELKVVAVMRAVDEMG